MWLFCGPSSVAFIKRLVFERVPINLLHGFRYARHSLLRQQKKYQITFFGREWLFNAHSGGVWSVWEVAFFWLRVVQRNHIKRMQC